MRQIDRPCPHVAGFTCPFLPGLECPELPYHLAPGTPEAKAAYCRSEARQAGLDVREPNEREPQRYRK
jgi:hypothetical protein